MEHLVEGPVRGLEVEEHLPRLRLRQLVGGLHPLERGQPPPDLVLALKVVGKEAEPGEAVCKVLQVGVELVHRPDLEPELVHDGDEEGDRLGDQLGGVALVVLDGDWTVLLDALEGRGAV